MRVNKPLITLGLGLFTYGVGYDIVHYDDANTVSRVPFATAVSTATGSAVTYTSNYVTGDELRMSPREVKAQSVRAPDTAYPHQSYLVRLRRRDA
jgi:hypothetical protein